MAIFNASSIDFRANNRFGRERVLLAADNRDARIRTGLLLSRLGLQVTTAENGRDALEIAILARKVDYAFHLILLDIRAQESDAIESATLFRYADFAGPILACSQVGDAIAAKKYLNAGCNQVLSLPVHADRLCEVIEHHLSLTPAFAAAACAARAA